MKTNSVHVKYVLLLLVAMVLSLSSCKKEILIKNSFLSKTNISPKRNIETIEYKSFLDKAPLTSIGTLQVPLIHPKTGLSIASDVDTAQFELDTTIVKRLIIGDTISYIISLKPQTKHANNFQNLTIQTVKGEKSTSFITNYIPNSEWIKAWKEKKPIQFKGAVQRVTLATDIQPTKSLGFSTQGPSANPTIKISNVYYDCETIGVYELVPHACSTGDMPGFCRWESDRGLNMGMLDYLPYYTIEVTYYESCIELPNGGNDNSNTSGGSWNSGGGSTSPNIPPDYDPCGAGVMVNSGFQKNAKGTEILLAPLPSPCDEMPPIIPRAPTVPSAAQQLIMQLSITDTLQINFLNSNIALANQLLSYLNTNGNSVDSRSFVKWAVGYLYENTDIDFETLEHNFKYVNEGEDEAYDDNFWSNLTLQQQSLPSLSSLISNYPHKVINGKKTKMMNSEVYALIGGGLYNKHLTDNKYKNACALRLSIGLNGISGHQIPSNDKIYSQDGKNYILGAKAMNTYLHKKYGSPSISSINTPTILNSYTNIMNALKGKNAIYSIT